VYSYTKKHAYPLLNLHEAPGAVPSAADLAIQSAAGVLGAVAGVAVTNPFDIARGRLQTKAGGGVSATGGIWANLNYMVETQGWRSLTRGANVRILNSLPFSITGILVYEFVKKLSVKEPQSHPPVVPHCDGPAATIETGPPVFEKPCA